MTNYGTRLFSPRLFGQRLFRGGPPVQIGGAGVRASTLRAPAPGHDDNDQLRVRLLEDDETLIFAIAAWAASRRLQ